MTTNTENTATTLTRAIISTVQECVRLEVRRALDGIIKDMVAERVHHEIRDLDLTDNVESVVDARLDDIGVLTADTFDLSAHVDGSDLAWMLDGHLDFPNTDEVREMIEDFSADTDELRATVRREVERCFREAANTVMEGN